MSSTIKDVAELAGVSIATVSCALSGAKPVKAETRARIMQAIEELGYIPNHSARTLKASSSQTIGIVVPDIRSELRAGIFNSLSACLQDKGYIVHIAFTNGIPAEERKAIDDLLASGIDGIIVITCQPDNGDFFRSRFVKRRVPILFVEWAPNNFPASFFGFHNYRSSYMLTGRLLERGYRDILLMCGPTAYSSEQNSVRGYRDAFEAAGLAMDEALICSTYPSKEDAFRVYLEKYASRGLEAILSTSHEISKGISLAAPYCGQIFGKNLILVSFGEESWDNLSTESGKYFTSRQASRLGELAGERILEDIARPDFVDPVFVELEDNAPDLDFEFPAASTLIRVASDTNYTPENSIRILLPEISSTGAIRDLTPHFTQKYGIKVEYIIRPQDQLFDIISALVTGHSDDSDASDDTDASDEFDIFSYNAPWLSFMAQHNYLANLNDFYAEYKIDTSRFFTQNMENCIFNGKLYGFPFTAGGQVLFYRSDLFSDREIMNRFGQEFSLSLRPPRTWAEYNNIARFFTRSYNSDSPTLYGTSFTGINNEDMAPEILIRLWSFGGALWNAYNHPTFYTQANVNAFLNLLETLRYVSPDYMQKSITAAVKDFCRGESAVLITFTEYAHHISRSLRDHLHDKFGAYHIPGRRPAHAGWSFGLNPNSRKKQAVYKYLDWLSERRTNFFLTVLNGASPYIEPYHNYDLQKLYPWLKYSEKSILFSMARNMPGKANMPTIRSQKIEAILCDAFRDAISGTPADKALQKAQLNAEALYKEYGYPVGSLSSKRFF